MADKHQKVTLGAETKPGLTPNPGAGTGLGKNGPSPSKKKYTAPVPDAGLNPVKRNAQKVQLDGGVAGAQTPDIIAPSNVKLPGATDPATRANLPNVVAPETKPVPDVVVPDVVVPDVPVGIPEPSAPITPVPNAGKQETVTQNVHTTLPPVTVQQVTLPQATWTPVQAPTLAATQMPDAPSADIAAMRAQLEDWQAMANAQNANRVNYGVNQAVTELQRAEQDAQAQFKEQVESVALDERQGMDNSALYAEARGDKGGIGQAQYNAIQAAAAQNRLAVQQQQTKLSTDTARQIADLRAKGEFEKADAMLETAQTYLTQLTQLEQWAANYGMDAAQFKAALAQWQAEYDMAMSKYKTDVDMYNSEMQYQAGRDQVSDVQWQQSFDADQKQNGITNQLKAQSQLASMGEAMLDAGMMPSAEQLSAMGLTKAQAQEWVIAARLKAAQGSAGASPFGTSGATSVEGLYQKLKDAGVTTAEGAQAYLTAWGVTSPNNYTDGFTQWYRNSLKGSGNVTGGARTELPGGGYITDTINPTAQSGRVYQYMMGWWDTGKMDPSFMIEQIEGALKNGNMTEEEADILMDYMGM